jgi:ribosomal protein L11 methyltransferase
VKTFPALDIRASSTDVLLALIDDFGPTAVEDRSGSVRVFFSRSQDRDAARRAVNPRFPVAAIDVPDDGWALRSLADLRPIQVGRLTIVPSHRSRSAIRPPQSAIVIPPSLAFGTGHHRTTQLCLEALQAIDLTGSSVLDIGTGSGILAIAAVTLGARRARGIDTDEDAVHTARGNLRRNPKTAGRVRFDVADLSTCRLDRPFVPDVVVANLTGALLVRSAARLLTAVRGGGTLILSGIQIAERPGIVRAFRAGAISWERAIDEWLGVAVKKP